MNLDSVVLLLMVFGGTVADILQNDIKTKFVTIATCGENEYLHNSECESCTECGTYEYIRTKCNNSRNTVCECMPGFYRDISDDQCKQCTKCAVGWGASPACTSTSNTVCVACPRDSYSSIESSTKSCQSCTLCDQRNEYVLQKCAAQQDTTCFKVKQKTAESEGLTESVCENGNCDLQKDSTYLYTAPLYCAVLGAIIFGLLMYVIIRYRNNKKRRTAQQATAHSKQPGNYPVAHQMPSNYTANLARLSTSPIVYLQHGNKTVTVTAALKYKDLPSSIRRTLSHNLSLDGSWLQLAHSLGFMPSEISQIQQKAEYNCKGISAATILLNEWSKRDFSSVGVIAHALASINRLDLVTLIHSSNSMKGSEVV